MIIYRWPSDGHPGKRVSPQDIGTSDIYDIVDDGRESDHIIDLVKLVAERMGVCEAVIKRTDTRGERITYTLVPYRLMTHWMSKDHRGARYEWMATGAGREYTSASLNHALRRPLYFCNIINFLEELEVVTHAEHCGEYELRSDDTTDERVRRDRGPRRRTMCWDSAIPGGDVSALMHISNRC